VSGSIYLGLMSGSSLDGIDAVLVDFSGPTPALLAALTHPLDEELCQALAALSLHDSSAPLAQIAALDVRVAAAHADAAEAVIQASGLRRELISAVGMHGQTIAHQPRARFPFSWQLGDGNVLAERLRLPVACDFRRRDVAAGGEGAPLVPMLHQALFSNPQEDRAVLNLGGIANLTLLPRAKSDPIRGFDTGPGNSIMDLHAQRLGLGRCDQNGAFAASGRVHSGALTRLLQHPFFAQHAPKSTHRDAFGYDWATEENLAPADTAATLAALTVHSVVNALRAEMPGCQRLIVCGGGVHNAHLMAQLADLLAPTMVVSSQSFGVDPDYIEAIAFALLAQLRVEQRDGNLAAVTGARSGRVLSALYAG
jgi:anhydro-N-acetylmuramic acid kinase